MNSENSKASDPHRLLLNLTDKIDLRRKDGKMEKYKKSHIRTINSKYQLQHGMNYLNYLLDHILYQIFKVILNMY